MWSKFFILFLAAALNFSCTQKEEPSLRLWYDEPARAWTEALPVGNGRLGAMVFGRVDVERIQFNEETLWTGEPRSYAHKNAHKFLEVIRALLQEGKQEEAHDLAMENFMSIPLRQMEFQPFGDLYLIFPPIYSAVILNYAFATSGVFVSSFLIAMPIFPSR